VGRRRISFERHPPGAGDGERDDLGDVVGGDSKLFVEQFGALFGGRVGDVVGELSVHGADETP
jgi:hypothetical protein